MDLKPLQYAIPTGRAGEDSSQVAPHLLEPLVRRLAGDGPVNLFRAKAEVDAVLWATGGTIPGAPPIEDELPPSAIPSVAAGSLEERVLAEIDQDGFAFAVDPRDEPFFNRRARRAQRQQNLVDLVLIEGRVCIRKRVRGLRFRARLWGDRPVPAGDWVRRNLWTSLGLYFYTEAAALLRLRDLPFVPRLRRIDFARSALYLDYVAGENLRTRAAQAGAPVHDADVKLDPGLGRLNARELERREVTLLEQAVGGDFRGEIARMVQAINARGVAPLDIKLGNFIRGARTGRLYWIDFEIARLQSQPRWEADLAEQRALLEELFDLSAHGNTVA